MRSLIFLLLFSFNATAALYDRGNGLIYDDVLDITWLQDINYRYTSSGVAGGMSFHSAKEWTENLNYGGFSDWRLPRVNAEDFWSINNYNSEIGYMSSVNLGNTSTLINLSFIDSSSGETRSFTSGAGQIFHLLGGTPLSTVSNIQWDKISGNHILGSWGNSGYAWAVHDSDIGNPVPLPAGIYLFLSGLVGLGLMRGRND